MIGAVTGVVLAGGAGKRLGGAKAMVELAGRPLVSYPLAAFAKAGLDAVVVAKGDTALPDLDVPVLREPSAPRHPLLGVISALEQLRRPIVACPVDTPFVTADLLARLAEQGAPATAHDGERLHPLIACYEPASLPGLEDAVATGAAARDALAALGPKEIPATSRSTFNVNTDEDLELAASMLTRAWGSKPRAGRGPASSDRRLRGRGESR